MKLRFSVNGVEYECEGEAEEFESLMASVTRLTALTTRAQQTQQDAPPRLVSKARINRLQASMDIMKPNNNTRLQEVIMPHMLEEVQRITAEDPSLQKLLDRLTDTTTR